MKKTIVGVTLLGIAASPAAALTEYANTAPVEINRQYRCWYFETIGPDDYRQRSFIVEAASTRAVLPACFAKYKEELDRQNKMVRRV